MPRKASGSDAATTRQGRAPAHSTNPIAGDASPDHQDIARLAYSYWEARGCNGGSPEEDWFRAENELKMSRASVGE